MMRTRSKRKKQVNLGRHEANCTICSHNSREEIERDFVAWKSPTAIAAEYGLSDRSTVYRHARACGLVSRRRRNVCAALERIIEKAGEVDVTSAAVVAAIQAYAKINASGQWVERSEHLNLNELFDRMTSDELESYAREGKLPDWFIQTVGATATDSGDSLSD
jgi:hypothetical protein